MEINNILADRNFLSDSPGKKPIAVSDNFKIMRLCLKKGVVVPPHDANHSAFFLILEGKGIITKDHEKIELKQNEFIFLKENEIRGIESLEDLVILAVRD